MGFTSVGDLLSNFQMRRQSIASNDALNRLSHELVSGRKSDIAAETDGNFSILSAAHRSLDLTRTFTSTGVTAALKADAIQSVLSGIESRVSGSGPRFLDAAFLQNSNQIQTVSATAHTDFIATVAELNTAVAGQSLFAGVATDDAALLDGAAILDLLQSQIASAASGDDALVIIDQFFNDPAGGFETTAYLGSSVEVAPFRITDTESVAFVPTALDTNLRQSLQGLATASLIARGAFSGSTRDQAVLIESAGNSLMSATTSLIALQSGIGDAQARIETAKAFNNARQSSLAQTISDMSRADPYATATALQEQQTQIETLYLVTGRLANLSFLNFLR